MPATVPELLYLIMYACILAGVAIIGWLVNRGFNSMVENISGVKGEVAGLRTEIKQEREDRISAYGEMRADIAAHKAICEERHRRE